MDDETRLFILALIDDSVVLLLGLSVVFFIVSGALSLMKWVGVF